MLAPLDVKSFVHHREELEIAGKDSIIIEEEDWDFKPLSLYKPPKMNFERIIKNDFDVSINIKEISKNYIDVMSGVCR